MPYSDTAFFMPDFPLPAAESAGYPRRKAHAGQAKSDPRRRPSQAKDRRRFTSIIPAELSLSIQLHAKLSAIFQYLI